MPETREILITIKNPTQQAKEPAGSPGSTQAANAEPLPPSESESNPVSTKAMDDNAAMAAVGVALNWNTAKKAATMALQEVDYRIARSFYLKDDYIGQRNYQVAKAEILAVLGYAGVIGANIRHGNYAGAITYAIAAPVSNLLSYSHKIEEQNLTIKRMEATLDFSRQRAGYSLTSGSVGENL